MELHINGETLQLPDDIRTVEDLLIHFQLHHRIVIVEVNRNIIQKEDYKQATLSDQDQVEIVHFVGGG
jgi:sulfur carrier protein